MLKLVLKRDFNIVLFFSYKVKSSTISKSVHSSFSLISIELISNFMQIIHNHVFSKKRKEKKRESITDFLSA